jgi:hypothetical protein
VSGILLARSTRSALLCLLGVLASMPGADGAGPGPTDELGGAIDRVLAVLDDPALKEPARAVEAYAHRSHPRLLEITGARPFASVRSVGVTRSGRGRRRRG